MRCQRDKILVVDDEADTRVVLADVLSDEGYLVETARDGRTALESARAFVPDLVLTDYWMPGMNGVELIRRLRAHNPSGAVLLMTARTDQDLPGRGVVHCLEKPMELENLLWKVDCALACGRQSKALR